MATPTTNNDGANKKYVDDHIGPTPSDVPTLTGDNIFTGVNYFHSMTTFSDKVYLDNGAFISKEPTLEYEVVSKKYVDDHFEEFLDWFKLIDKTVVDAELSKENIKKSKNKLILQEKMYTESEHILGLKRYLLHFNQVPREYPLNENTYKSLLVCSVLLGIESDVSKEILRKNSDNIFADKLQEFSHMRGYYKGIYSQIKNRIVLIKKTKKKEELEEDVSE